MITGWIKLYRSLLDNQIWKMKEPYDKRSAWIYLLLNASFGDRDVEFKGEIIHLKSGTLIDTYRHFSDTWMWTLPKVQRYIEKLKAIRMINAKRYKGGTLISIVNWEFYQGLLLPTDTLTDTHTDTTDFQDRYAKNQNPIHQPIQEVVKTDTLTDTKSEFLPNYIKESNKNIKKDKEYITDTNVSVRQTEAVRQAITEWNKLVDFGIPQVSRLSPDSKRYKNLNARINQYGIDEVLRAINNIRKSSFLQGRNKNGWSIKFDWFILPNNFPKVLEGNYTDREDVNADGLSAVDREFLERHKDDRY